MRGQSVEGARPVCGQTFDYFRVADEDEYRLAVAPLQFVQGSECFRVEGVCAEAVEGVCAEGDDAARGDDLRRALARLFAVGVN